ncbi:hypothetical protein O4213_21145 [Gordonia rubripertincta]|uniref:Uncharacterized protein n=1 Tax=Gordonia rubripertincta TaxID=36822 RepID=A0ABT4MZR3_GORRU|nr:hypothetical protein [Gordonia rubripertincta]MCZ4552510.1 hypothetical protein [Gordonia rubripertincta]
MSGRVDIFSTVENRLGDVGILHRVGHDEIYIATDDLFKRRLEVEVVMKNVLAVSFELDDEIDVAAARVKLSVKTEPKTRNRLTPYCAHAAPIASASSGIAVAMFISLPDIE